MSNIVISLSDSRMQQLRELAEQLQIPAEDLARVGLEDMLTRSQEELRRVIDHVLQKNAELYRRLA